jgi:ubiquinone/menaquinone biosynthesis C-methylase UbiE
METRKKFGEALQLSPEEMAIQLRRPEGEIGIKVGEQMNIGNEHICKNTYLVSNLQENETVLEIGMGNGLFVNEYLSATSNTKYVGVDFSSLMVSESIKNNESLILSKRVTFVEASIEKLPFEDNSFDKIVTANTLYFWPMPKQNTQELLRVLKPEGQLVIGYRHKEFMDKLELANYGFSK